MAPEPILGFIPCWQARSNPTYQGAPETWELEYEDLFTEAELDKAKQEQVSYREAREGELQAKFEKEKLAQETQVWMQSVLGENYGRRKHPRVREIKGRVGLFIVLGRRRTKKAAFRAARHLRDGTKPKGTKRLLRGKENRPLRVWPLPLEPGRTTHDWAYGVRAKPKKKAAKKKVRKKAKKKAPKRKAKKKATRKRDPVWKREGFASKAQYDQTIAESRLDKQTDRLQKKLDEIEHDQWRNDMSMSRALEDSNLARRLITLQSQVDHQGDPWLPGQGTPGAKTSWPTERASDRIVRLEAEQDKKIKSLEDTQAILLKRAGNVKAMMRMREKGVFGDPELSRRRNPTEEEWIPFSLQEVVENLVWLKQLSREKVRTDYDHYSVDELVELTTNYLGLKATGTYEYVIALPWDEKIQAATGLLLDTLPTPGAVFTAMVEAHRRLTRMNPAWIPQHMQKAPARRTAWPWTITTSKTATGDFYITRKGKKAGEVHPDRKGPNDFVVSGDATVLVPKYFYYLAKHLEPNLKAAVTTGVMDHLTKPQAEKVFRDYFTRSNPIDPDELEQPGPGKLFPPTENESLERKLRWYFQQLHSMSIDWNAKGRKKYRRIRDSKEGGFRIYLESIMRDISTDKKVGFRVPRGMYPAKQLRWVINHIGNRLKNEFPENRENPEILSVAHTNPVHTSQLQMEKAARKYRQFHGVDPDKITTIGNPEAADAKVLIVLGRLVDLIYEPSKGLRKTIHWHHKFGKDARLATDISGKKLYIVGKQGQVQVDFSRGIIS